jgi:hypothetical protein
VLVLYSFGFHLRNEHWLKPAPESNSAHLFKVARVIHDVNAVGQVKLRTRNLLCEVPENKGTCFGVCLIGIDTWCNTVAGPTLSNHYLAPWQDNSFVGFAFELRIQIEGAFVAVPSFCDGIAYEVFRGLDALAL